MATLFPFPINWSKGYHVTREFRTTIQTSRSGKEQRRALRNTPRKTVSFSVDIFTTQWLSFTQWMKTNIGQTIVVADESQTAQTTAELTPSEATIQIAAIPTWVGTGAIVVLRYQTQMAYVVVTGVTSTTITISSATGLDWPAGTTVLAGLQGRFATKVDTSLVTDQVITAGLTLTVSPLSEYLSAPNAPLLTFNGREVVTIPMNWSSSPKVSFSNDYEVVDFGYGPTDYYNPIAYISRTQQASYLSATASAQASLEAIFLRAMGQLHEFYLPTWQNDMPVATGAAIGASSFLAVGTTLATDFGNDTVFKAICIFYNDGSMQLAMTQSLATSGSNTLVTLTGALTRAIDSAVTKISWMPAHRFASDSLISEWITNGVAQTQLSVVSLEDLAPGA